MGAGKGQMGAIALQGGFADPAHEAARAFRACLDAMARPGTIHAVTGAQPPAPCRRRPAPCC